MAYFDLASNRTTRNPPLQGSACWSFHALHLGNTNAGVRYSRIEQNFCLRAEVRAVWTQGQPLVSTGEDSPQHKANRIVPGTPLPGKWDDSALKMDQTPTDLASVMSCRLAFSNEPSVSLCAFARVKFPQFRSTLLSESSGSLYNLGCFV